MIDINEVVIIKTKDLNSTCKNIIKFLIFFIEGPWTCHYFTRCTSKFDFMYVNGLKFNIQMAIMISFMN